MIRNFAIEKKGEGYSIEEQQGSDPHREYLVYEAKSREAAAKWLRKEGGAPDLIDTLLNDAKEGERVFFEAGGSFV